MEGMNEWKCGRNEWMEVVVLGYMGGGGVGEEGREGLFVTSV